MPIAIVLIDLARRLALPISLNSQNVLTLNIPLGQVQWYDVLGLSTLETSFSLVHYKTNNYVFYTKPSAVRIAETSLRTKITLQLAILYSLLIVVAVIQVLPQVDLPDTAFHEDTAPIVTKSRAVAVPVLSVAQRHDYATWHQAATLATTPEKVSTTPHRANLSLPILLLAILC